MFFNFISAHGLDTVLIGLATVFLTGIIKIPIKYLANKSSKGNKITRFITFLPIFIGFGLTVLMTCLTGKKVVFEEAFFAQWLSAVSFSLAIYAFWEKFVPSEKKILSEAEIEANKKLVEELKNKVNETNNVSANSNLFEEASDETTADENVQAVVKRKIIVTNNKKN